MYRFRQAARLVGLWAAGCAAMAWAQSNESVFSPTVTALASTSPYALFEYSTITGSGNTISVSWIPVVSSTGVVSYKDMSLQFTVDASGNLTLASGYPKITASATPTVSGFRAGRYVGPSSILGGNAIINVSGPAIAAGGATEWALATAVGASGCTYPTSATWYVGAIASNPLAARIKAAGITSTAWSYGVGAGQCYGTWAYTPLLGLSQVGNTLTIVSFTNSSGDHALPVDQITYTLAP